MLRLIIAGVVVMAAPLLCAQAAVTGVPPKAQAAQVVVLGEQHDNPQHHAVQAEWVAALSPRAVVFEMLTEAQAARAKSDMRSDPEALADALDWQASGWPDFAMYFPIFAAAPEAAIYGAAIPREDTRRIISEGLGPQPEAARFGLTEELPTDQQTTRETLQADAHCGALPDELLPGMVKVQRARDAALARAALAALSDTGGPVVVITGNGHARADWGVPSLMARADPDVNMFALGQGEAGIAPAGQFDLVLDAPAVDRGDPCAAFR